MAHVLIVDDEPAIALALEFLMQQDGHAVTSVRTAADALAAPVPDVVLLDVMLPDGSGLDVCRALKARDAAPHVLMISARGRDVDAAHGLAAGADGYLTKPFAIADVAARVRALLAGDA